MSCNYKNCINYINYIFYFIIDDMIKNSYYFKQCYNIKLNYFTVYNQQMITYMYDIIQNTLKTDLSQLL